MSSFYRENFGECSQDVCPDTYSLWQTSPYYDTNNLNYQNIYYKRHEDSSPVVSESDPGDDVAIIKPRVVKKEVLLQHPDLYGTGQQESSASPPDQDGYHYKGVHRAGAAPAPAGKKERRRQKVRLRMKRHHLHKMKDQPAGKGDSVMQKLGWEGGDLGRAGDALGDPMLPNIHYTDTALPFNRELDIESTKKPDREHFQTNVLLYIREFVSDDTEMELLFDAKLQNNQRFAINTIVQNLMGDTEKLMNFESMTQMDLMNDIIAHNHYKLVTQYEGEGKQRQLCLYKEAPDNVYLITPDDFKSESETQTEPETEAEEIETNPFLLSITRNLKKDSDMTIELENCTINDAIESANPLTKMTDFFLEFCGESYNELRFLGPFDLEQVDVMNNFLSDLLLCISEFGSCLHIFQYKSTELAAALKKNAFEIKEDNNGSVFILKKAHAAHRDAVREGG